MLTPCPVSVYRQAPARLCLLLIYSESLIVPRGVDLVPAFCAVTFPPAWNLASHVFVVVFVATLLKLFYVATVSLWLVGLKL